MADQTPLVRGTLDVLVLKALSWAPMHGFEIASWIEDRSGGRLDIADAALLQALHRLEERGWIAAEWGVSELGRRAKFYHLTPLGRRQLKTETAQWTRFAAAVSKVLVPAER